MQAVSPTTTPGSNPVSLSLSAAGKDCSPPRQPEVTAVGVGFTLGRHADIAYSRSSTWWTAYLYALAGTIAQPRKPTFPRSLFYCYGLKPQGETLWIEKPLEIRPSLDATVAKAEFWKGHNYSSSQVQGTWELCGHSCHRPQDDLGGRQGTGEWSQDRRSLSCFWNETQATITSRRTVSFLHCLLMCIQLYFIFIRVQP